MISPTVTISQLRALVATVDEGGIGRAADRLGLAQSAVSQQLSTLERAVGMQLLDRQPGPIPAVPTPAAAILVEHARAILARIQVLGADAVRLREEHLGRVRLGCFMSVGARILPRLLAEIHSRDATVEIEVVERDVDEELVDGLAGCEVDLAFVTLPVRSGPFAWRELLTDPHVLLAPASHPLSTRTTAPSVTELAALPLIGFRNDPSEERRLEGVLRAHGLEPRVVLRTDNNLAIPELVAAGLGVAIVPRLALPELSEDRRLRAIPLAAATIPPRRIGICWHAERHLGRAAETVLQLAQEVCASLALDPRGTSRSAEAARARAVATDDR